MTRPYLIKDAELGEDSHPEDESSSDQVVLNAAWRVMKEAGWVPVHQGVHNPHIADERRATARQRPTCHAAIDCKKYSHLANERARRTRTAVRNLAAGDRAPGRLRSYREL
jgi:hypothetical protein